MRIRQGSHLDYIQQRFSFFTICDITGCRKMNISTVLSLSVNGQSLPHHKKKTPPPTPGRGENPPQVTNP